MARTRSGKDTSHGQSDIQAQLEALRELIAGLNIDNLQSALREQQAANDALGARITQLEALNVLRDRLFREFPDAHVLENGTIKCPCGPRVILSLKSYRRHRRRNCPLAVVEPQVEEEDASEDGTATTSVSSSIAESAASSDEDSDASAEEEEAANLAAPVSSDEDSEASAEEEEAANLAAPVSSDEDSDASAEEEEAASASSDGDARCPSAAPSIDLMDSLSTTDRDDASVAGAPTMSSSPSLGEAASPPTAAPTTTDSPYLRRVRYTYR